MVASHNHHPAPAPAPAPSLRGSSLKLWEPPYKLSINFLDTKDERATLPLHL